MISSLLMQYLQENKEKVKQVIIKHIPDSEKVLSNKDWNKVIQSYIERVGNIPKDCNNMITSSCIIDLIICSLGETRINKSNKETVNAINAEINKAFVYCEKHPQFKSKVKNLVRKAIIEMDNDIGSCNSAFKNWINELYVFNLFAKKKNCEIVDIERPLGNGNTCDFVFKIGDNEEMWLEVVAIQRIDPSKQDNDTTMNEFINERVKKKYQDKIINLSPEKMPNIRILPIVEYVDGLEKFNIMLDSDISTEPFAIMKNNIDGVVHVELRPLNVFLSQIRAQIEKCKES